MPFGYNGKILRVDLTNRQIDDEMPDERIYRTYIGGGSLACYYLLKEQKAGVDPLGAENTLIFSTSAVSGTPAAGFSRFTVAAKSPLTGGFGETEAGGWFGPELKFAGYDAIIIKGRADTPVYLLVKDGRAEIKDARHLWGKSLGEVHDTIREELGDSRVRIAQIGPGGERLVRYACIINELKHVNGRTGMGAVMGAKNLRAIAVRGHGKMQLFDKEKVNELVRWHNAHYLETQKTRQDLGTAAGVNLLNMSGILPTRNFNKGEFDKAADISGEAMKEKILVGRGHCYACPVKCKREVEVKEPYSVNPRFGGPEYETIGALGSLCEIGDIKAIAKGNELCQQYGLDTISAGVCIAFAMECFENDILSKSDTEGLELTFGNAEAMVKLIEMIGSRQGIGDILAEGVLGAAQKIGNGAEKYAMHVKGQEIPMHEPRGKASLALAYTTSPTGADHVECPHDQLFFPPPNKNLDEAAMLSLFEPMTPTDLGPEKARYFYYLQNTWNLYNIIGVCIFTAWPLGQFKLDHIVEYVRAVTGWNTNLYELVKANERSQQLFRLFNTREGFTKKDDMLPERFFEPLQNGALKGNRLSREDFKKALESYYGMMGWDPDTGIPTPGKLQEVGLGWAVSEIKGGK
ncbi:MAG: aldehyde ferredoxin oxidoreductase family protein [Deltaproteobacteria bacterium]|nr:aldehyde ferredoxin oxidoreductase family protein [Deltaproteobacteria bacterium]